ncbi:hypothetical protein PoB_005270000 [Plakobranchus ocellatus]|uniref:Uncharacterized protein n=1 Tax=Plakobranchus ocellatus TaxID=259542 RepID=A0AAV4C3J5_9GAST|nr:hypothetical protein PoB_005270000 [Plakobranchus ocellatus]
MAFLIAHMGYASVKGNYGSVVPAEELEQGDEGQMTCKPTIMEETQKALSSSAFLFLHPQVFPLAPHNPTEALLVPVKEIALRGSQCLRRGSPRVFQDAAAAASENLA